MSLHSVVLLGTIIAVFAYLELERAEKRLTCSGRTYYDD